MGIIKTAYLRGVAASSLAAALYVAAAAPAFAQEAHYAFDIPAQNLDAALRKFGRTTRLQIVYDGREARGLRSYALKGSFTARDGLAQLLEGSGFSMHVGQSGVLIVESAERKAAAAQAGNAAADKEGPAADDRGIADILVIGSNSQNTDIRRSENDPQPYRVFTQKDIQSSQAVTLEDFFRTRATSNTTQGSEAQRTSSIIGNGPGSTRSSINLRGLGTNQTLILVDGRRLGDLSIQNLGQSANQSGQPDINGIPLASIERIEILSSTAGGIYGGNAVGGVINIILRHDYRGLEITANYQDTADFKYPIGRLDVVGGLALEGGRTNITFGGSISRTGVLQVGDRSFAQKGFALGLKNSPEEFIPAAGQVLRPPVGRGVNIYSNNGAPLTLKPEYGGGALGGAITNLQPGFSGSSLDLGKALKANAGNFNFQEPTGDSGQSRSLLSAPETRSFNVNVRRKFADWLDVYADFSKFQNRGSALASTSAPEALSLASTRPTNPFNESVSVVFDNQNLATPYKSKTDTNRATLGFALRLPHKWAVGFDYTWNWSKASFEYTGLPIDQVGFQCARVGVTPSNVGTGLNQCSPSFGAVSTDPRAAINIITNPDFSAYLNPNPNVFGKYSTTLSTPSLRLSGPVFALPAGPVNFSGLLQRNIARTKFGYQQTDTYGSALNPVPLRQQFIVFAPAEQGATSVYGEVRIPLFSPRNATTLLQNLAIQASVRHDSYKTTAYKTNAGVSSLSFDDAIGSIGGLTQSATNQSTNYTIAGEYSPVTGITFRGSYGTGYLEPTVNQVVANAGDGNLRIQDPLRGNTVQGGLYTVVQGGLGFDFKPETSTSYSFGIILQPLFVPGDLRLSADYTKIRKTNEITSPNIFDLLLNPDRYPGRVVRAPLTAADTALGYTGGAFTSFNVTQINLFKSYVTAVDFQADYTFTAGKAGQFHAYVSASWEPDFYRQFVVNSPSLNFSGAIDGPLEWRGNGGIDWTLGNFSVQYNAQYYGPYRVYSPTEGASDVAFDVKLQGSSKIRSQIYHDLYVSYTIPASSGILRGVKVSGGIQNLFNTSPPIIASLSYAQGGYSGYGDPRLRRFTLTLRKAFGN
ncbi:TonB-dependent receptor [Sphingomonas bacterium]|uniref:TonB-dependent receptor n=1 Tax=Sphingomonas bacterium TaxID=1895847 RepID=UPI0015767DF5|nr:TonB-dependent receptor [Sphingomonas bacterium]